jgi:hypothetical protein
MVKFKGANIKGFIILLNWRYIGYIAGDTLKYQTSESKLR